MLSVYLYRGRGGRGGYIHLLPAENQMLPHGRDPCLVLDALLHRGHQPVWLGIQFDFIASQCANTGASISYATP